MSIDTSREVEKAREWAADNPRTAHQIGLDVALACLDAMSARLSDAIVERDQLRADVEHWIKRYNKLEQWRQQTSKLHLEAVAKYQAERTAREQAESRVRELEALLDDTGMSRTCQNAGCQCLDDDDSEDSEAQS